MDSWILHEYSLHDEMRIIACFFFRPLFAPISYAARIFLAQDM